MQVVGFVAVTIFFLFAFVVFFGAPYLPTLRPQINIAFELLNMKPGQTMLELGSGDGKVLLAAARAGYNVVGIELNPVLAIISRLRTWKYRKQVHIIWGNFWRVPWPETDAVFVFLLDRYMPRLDKHMQSYKKPLVSIAFRVPSRQTIDEKNGVFLYDYR